MKGILHKTEQGFYMLFDENKQWVGVTGDSDGKKLKLSKENCDEIFGVVDVEKLTEEYVDADPDLEIGTSEYHNAKVDFKEGFNKAMELNKDKLFTVDDVKKAFNAGWVQRHNEEGSHYENMETLIQSLQQPTEIEVEIEMDICGDKVYAVPEPKLDENGCLVLRKL